MISEINNGVHEMNNFGSFSQEKEPYSKNLSGWLLHSFFKAVLKLFIVEQLTVSGFKLFQSFTTLNEKECCLMDELALSLPNL
jgi:hypothetical protein